MGTMRDYLSEQESEDLINKMEAGKKDTEIPLGVRIAYLNIEIAIRELYVACLKAAKI